MKTQTLRCLIFLVFLPLLQTTVCSAKLIISDSIVGLLPKNSTPAVAITIDQGANTLHLELVMTGDNHVLVLGDTILNNVTDVAELFPDRIRADGTFQTLDFTLEEIQKLSLRPFSNTLSTPSDESLPFRTTIRIPTLSEILSLIALMEQSYQRPIGIVAELKKDWIHRHEGKDLVQAVLTNLEDSKFPGNRQLFLASYDPETLQKVHDLLALSETARSVALIQLIDHNEGSETMRFERGKWYPYNYDWMFTRFGLKSLSTYASVIGLRPETLVSEEGSPGRQEYLEDAHLLDLQIICHSFDPLMDNLPLFVRDQKELIEYFLFTREIDGLITGNSVQVRRTIERYLEEQAGKETTGKTSIEILLENIKKESGSSQDKPLLQ